MKTIFSSSVRVKKQSFLVSNCNYCSHASLRGACRVILSTYRVGLTVSGFMVLYSGWMHLKVFELPVERGIVHHGEDGNYPLCCCSNDVLWISLKKVLNPFKHIARTIMKVHRQNLDKSIMS